MKINQFEPKISKKDKEAVSKYLNSGGWLTENKVTEELENRVAEYVNRKFAIAVPNGTQAIYLSLIAAGVEKGSTVAVPNISMIATINAIIWAGAKPYIVDTDKDLCMDIDKLKKIKNLDAVIYVPLNGRTKNGLLIEKWCKENHITLVEDSAHALGSKYQNNKMCGSLGDLSVFSFTPHKIITMGQGGMVLTDNKKLKDSLFKIKTFNRMKNKSDWHEGFGLNFKITDLQSSIGLSQFDQLENFIEIKKQNYLKLKKFIINEKVNLCDFEDHETPWFYDIKFKSKSLRNKFSSYMKTHNIETRIHYPCMSKQKYLNNTKSTNLETSESLDELLLWLPSSTNLNDKDIKYISKTINNFQ